MLSKMSEEFDERNCKLLAIGVDSKMGHRNFIKEVQVGSKTDPVGHREQFGEFYVRVVTVRIAPPGV